MGIVKYAPLIFEDEVLLTFSNISIGQIIQIMLMMLCNLNLNNHKSDSDFSLHLLFHS